VNALLRSQQRCEFPHVRGKPRHGESVRRKPVNDKQDFSLLHLLGLSPVLHENFLLGCVRPVQSSCILLRFANYVTKGCQIALRRSVQLADAFGTAMKDDKKIRKRQWVFTAIYVLWALSAIAFLRMASAPATPKQISYSDFLMQLRGGNVASVRITDRQVI